MSWLKKNRRKYIIMFLSILLTLFVSTLYFLLSKDDCSIYEWIIHIVVILLISGLLAYLNYRIDSNNTIRCTPDNFCKEYYCEYLHQVFTKNDSSNLIFTNNTITHFKLNEIGGLNSHIINNREHSISSERNYADYVKSCEIATGKAKKSIIMTYPGNPYSQKKEDPNILIKIKNASIEAKKKKVSMNKYVYIPSREELCNEIVKDYNSCIKKKQSVGLQNRKDILKEHFIYKYINEHRNFTRLRWIEGKSQNEIFIADDNIALIWNKGKKIMNIELRKSSFNLEIKESESQSTKDFFKSIANDLGNHFSGENNNRKDRDIKYCFQLLNIFQVMFFK